MHSNVFIQHMNIVMRIKRVINSIAQAIRTAFFTSRRATVYFSLCYTIGHKVVLKKLFQEVQIQTNSKESEPERRTYRKLFNSLQLLQSQCIWAKIKTPNVFSKPYSMNIPFNLQEFSSRSYPLMRIHIIGQSCNIQLRSNQCKVVLDGFQ